MVSDAIKIVETVDKLGLIAVLVLLVLWLGFMYMRAQKRIEDLHNGEIENSKETTAAIVTFEATLRNLEQTIQLLSTRRK